MVVFLAKCDGICNICIGNFQLNTDIVYNDVCKSYQNDSHINDDVDTKIDTLYLPFQISLMA